MQARASIPSEAQAPFVAVPTRSTPIAATLHPEAPWEDDKEADDTEEEETSPAA